MMHKTALPFLLVTVSACGGQSGDEPGASSTSDAASTGSASNGAGGNGGGGGSSGAGNGPIPPPPDWVPPPGEWAPVSLNTLDDVNPCPSNECSYSAVQGHGAIIHNWNGGALATGYGVRGGYIVWGGGHNGYFGNEIYLWDLETRLWSRVTEPVENPVCSQATGELQDGSPCSAHTYSYLNYHPATNSFVELGSASNHEEGGAGAPRVKLFSFDDNSWRTGADKPDFMTGTGASSAFDPNRGATGVFWYMPSYGTTLGYYDPSADTWTEFAQFWIDIDHQTAIDPTRDLMVTLDVRGSQSVIVHDLDDPDNPVTVTTANGYAPQSWEPWPGFAFHPPSATFVAWLGGSSVWQLVPPAGDWRTETWNWIEIEGQGTEPSSPNVTPGTYNRWQWAPSLDCFIVVTSTTTNVDAYRPSF
jgi:hypothetical protein